jgi:NADH-ubiquinone oxidoreductase chain 5
MIFLKKYNIIFLIIEIKIFFINIFIDYWSKLFIIAVLIISILIFIYINYYIKEEFFLKRFYFLVAWFILSIIILLISNNFFTLFIGWDGLGVSSYFLVIYYQNWKSINAGLVTILSNRIGDCFYIFILIYYFCYFNIDKINNFLFRFFVIRFFFVIFTITKRAQFPFSAWLPAAIAAPTPVSSLVHSRTLVTAGLYLLFRFFCINYRFTIVFITIIFSFVTLVYSGLNGLLEIDFKKIIALSTLSQLSLIFISLRIEIKIISYFHLFTHAFFKRVLFIRVGVIIHSFFNNQDLRSYNFLLTNILKATLFLSIFSLMGLFFSSGFLRKDFILEKIFVKKRSLFIIWIFFLVMFLTIFYSLRLLITSFYLKIKNRIFYFRIRLKSLLSLVILSLLSLVIGNFLNWNYLYFIWILCFIKYKFYVLYIFVNSILLFIFFNKIIFYKKLFIINFIFLLVKITFFVNKILTIFKKLINFFLEKSFLEIYERNFLYKTNNFSTLFINKNYLLYILLTIIIRFGFIFL